MANDGIAARGEHSIRRDGDLQTQAGVVCVAHILLNALFHNNASLPGRISPKWQLIGQLICKWPKCCLLLKRARVDRRAPVHARLAANWSPTTAAATVKHRRMTRCGRCQCITVRYCDGWCTEEHNAAQCLQWLHNTRSQQQQKKKKKVSTGTLAFLPSPLRLSFRSTSSQFWVSIEFGANYEQLIRAAMKAQPPHQQRQQ